MGNVSDGAATITAAAAAAARYLCQYL